MTQEFLESSSLKLLKHSLYSLDLHPAICFF